MKTAAGLFGLLAFRNIKVIYFKSRLKTDDYLHKAVTF